MKNNKQLKITEKDLKFIYGNDYDFFQSKILSNCHCLGCFESKYGSTVVNYKIFLNDLNDIILKGFCDENNRLKAEMMDTERYKKSQKLAKK